MALQSAAPRPFWRLASLLTCHSDSVLFTFTLAGAYGAGTPAVAGMVLKVGRAGPNSAARFT
jgi:hypothetical protein